MPAIGARHLLHCHVKTGSQAPIREKSNDLSLFFNEMGV
jgi:hypothetical protein